MPPPLGAIGVSHEIRSFFESGRTPLDHIFTFAANPVSAVAANTVLDIMEKESLVENAQTTGKYMKEKLGTLSTIPIVGDIRSLGLMSGIELVQDKKTAKPFDPSDTIAAKISRTALENGLVTYPGTGIVNGTAGDVISLFPPLVFTTTHVDEMVDKLEVAIKKTMHDHFA